SGFLEQPADARAGRLRGAVDHELLRGMRPAFAVHPQAVLHADLARADTELPECAIGQAQQRALPVGGQRRLDVSAEVETDGERAGDGPPAPRGWQQYVLAAQFAPVMAQHED